MLYKNIGGGGVLEMKFQIQVFYAFMLIAVFSLHQRQNMENNFMRKMSWCGFWTQSHMQNQNFLA